MNRVRRRLSLILVTAISISPIAAQEMRNILTVPAEHAAPEAVPEKWKGVTQTQDRKSNRNYFLPTGFTFVARLANTIYSLAQQSPVILVIERDVVYLNRVVIPAGTRVIGAALTEQNGDRILVQMGVLVFPTGDEVTFSGIALSLDGSVGLKGKVERQKSIQVANQVLRAVVTGTEAAVEAAAANPITSQVTQGVGQEAIKELDGEKQRAVTVDKSITVNADAEVSVYLPQRLEY